MQQFMFKLQSFKEQDITELHDHIAQMYVSAVKLRDELTQTPARPLFYNWQSCFQCIQEAFTLYMNAKNQHSLGELRMFDFLLTKHVYCMYNIFPSA